MFNNLHDSNYGLGFDADDTHENAQVDQGAQECRERAHTATLHEGRFENQGRVFTKQPVRSLAFHLAAWLNS